MSTAARNILILSKPCCLHGKRSSMGHNDPPIHGGRASKAEEKERNSHLGRVHSKIGRTDRRIDNCSPTGATAEEQKRFDTMIHACKHTNSFRFAGELA